MKQGFTLIEITFVLAIFAILLAISVPSFRAMNNESKISQVKVELSILKATLDVYYVQYGCYPSAAGVGGYQEQLITKTNLINQKYIDPFTKEQYRYIRPVSNQMLLLSPGINKVYEIDPNINISKGKFEMPKNSDDIFVTSLVKVSR